MFGTSSVKFPMGAQTDDLHAISGHVRRGSLTVAEKYLLNDRVRDTDRVDMVRDIFSTITGKYDFLNHVLSLRRDIFWRRFTVRQIRLFKTRRFLDVATGTCDLAIEAARRSRRIHVTGIDFSEAMLRRGKTKLGDGDLSETIALIQGDALHLPFPEGSFDAVGMAFGIRNIPDKLKALNELRRVTVPGGEILILELTLPQAGYFHRGYDLYLKRLLPRVAGVFSPHPEAYHYLSDSIMEFPSVAGFAAIMQSAGWVQVRAYALTLGICRLFVGRKAESWKLKAQSSKLKAKRRSLSAVA